MKAPQNQIYRWVRYLFHKVSGAAIEEEPGRQKLLQGSYEALAIVAQLPNQLAIASYPGPA